ncbi:hypothetical protein E3N88_28804 [Mikania micrantha]|uniref:Uncharacterized protein n=1 Tax=Mikania micrantha TaxID=192012 RepID=A0A5N6N0I0_9ASTR|nr:hypothetical protein E3N88_28804 [Mikania micrantha]
MDIHHQTNESRSSPMAAIMSFILNLCGPLLLKMELLNGNHPYDEDDGSDDDDAADEDGEDGTEKVRALLIGVTWKLNFRAEIGASQQSKFRAKIGGLKLSWDRGSRRLGGGWWPVGG